MISEDSDVLDDEDYDSCLYAMYLYDETALKLALRENDAQSLAVGLIYLDNYEEALASVEEVRRSLFSRRCIYSKQPCGGDPPADDLRAGAERHR